VQSDEARIQLDASRKLGASFRPQNRKIYFIISLENFTPKAD
jgi:hypothetical protein